MTANYVLLEKITVGATGASEVTFSNIPQTGYTDLVLKISTRSNQTNIGYTVFRFNGSSTGYSQKFLSSNGTSAPVSYGGLSSMLYTLGGSTTYANYWDSTEIYIANYTSANNKSMSIDNVIENGTTSDALVLFEAATWANSAAITSVTFYAADQGLSFNRVFQADTTFYLYGVAKLGTVPEIAPQATGGSIIETDGTYWYHTFLSSGTFTPAKGLSCDYLVVAGGGGGGNGGGGAGGYRTNSSALAVNTSYTITVGAGGANGVKGNNSSIAGSGFTTFSSTGGGQGGSGATSPAGYGQPGGSGGGGANDTGAIGGAGNQGGYTPVEGYAGGSRISGTDTGGGGGSSAVGGNAPSNGTGGPGGAGTANSITGSSVTYAGGGGGGGSSGGSAGGAGGGGAGSSQGGTAGTANTGGGGGGGYNQAGGAGGSGIVVVRYLV